MKSFYSALTAILFIILCAAGCKKKPEYPLCSNDGDCREGEFCVNGSCVECRTNEDCPGGKECIEGLCAVVVDAPDEPGEGETSSGSLQTPYEECSLANIYFAFDSAELKPKAVEALKKSAECLLSKGAEDIVIVGHCDPRGTEEYNMGLGLERAHAIKKYLANYGIPEGEMTTYSKGEEDATGYNKATWAEDRKGIMKK